MKRFFIALGILLVGVAAGAQTLVRHDTRAEIFANPDKAGGVYYMLDTIHHAPTPAPRGYRSVYISHIGRHGARYAISDNIYEAMKRFLEQADKDGVLTPEGKALLSRYEAFYPQAAFRGGDLTRKGQAQHRFIARTMVQDYPEVFRGKTHAEVISTRVPRVIMSMLSFLDEMNDLDRDFNFRTDAGYVYLPVLEPSSGNSPEARRRKPTPALISETANAMQDAFPARETAGRFFSDVDYLEKGYGAMRFIRDLGSVITDTQCLDDPADRLDGVLTTDELYRLWEMRNYGFYTQYGRHPKADKLGAMQAAKMVQDFIVKADEDLASGAVNLRLRFSHDTGLMPLMSFMKVDNFGVEVEDPHEIMDYWRSFEIPMGCNFQLVFFRRKGGAKGGKSGSSRPEILVKPLLNGYDARLPFESWDGPFYDWQKFKAYYNPLIDDALRYLETY